MAKISAQSDAVYWSYCPKTFVGLFKHCVCLSGRNFETLQTFETLNLATTNAILMNLTTDTYLNKVFHLARCWGVTHRL